ncbi:hypothetical protein V6N13_041548 [Hibiscus sabdariffa]
MPQNPVVTPQIISAAGTDVVHISVVGTVDFDKNAVLERSTVGVCRRPITLELLAVGLESDQIRGFHLMRLSGSRVLLIFQDIQVRSRVVELSALDNWFESVLVWSPRACKSNQRVWLTMYGIPVHAWVDRTFENIPSIWGNFVRIDGETSDAVSFERARVLIETDWLCNIDEVVDLEVEGENFEVRIVETDRGAVQFERVDVVVSKSEEVDERQEEEVKSDEISLCVVAVQDTNQVGLENVQSLLEEQDSAVVATINVALNDGVDGWDQNEAGLELGLCSNAMDKDTEVVQYQGDSRKVRSLSEIMFHCCPPEERLIDSQRLAKKLQGHARKTKSKRFANASLSDSDFERRKSVILHEARETLQLWKLLGATTIGNEEETKLEAIDASLVCKLWISDTFEFLFCPTEGRSGGVLMVWDEAVLLCKSHLLGGHLFGCMGDGHKRLGLAVYLALQAGRHPWCIVGDFNVVRTVEERQGMVSLARGMCEFNEFIEDLDLADLPLKGYRFTWFGSGNKCSRVDRFLLSVEWLEAFRVMDETDWGPKPFRFINAWVDNPHNVQRMGIEWGKLSESFTTGDVLSKFRTMRQFLRVWNAKEFGSIDDQIESYELLLDGLDDRVARGEADTHFFHRTARIRGMRNLISGGSGRLQPDLNFRLLSVSQAANLEMVYSEHEVSD